MDRESLTLIISRFDKIKFGASVSIVLNDILGLNASNADIISTKKELTIDQQNVPLYIIVMDGGLSVDVPLAKKKIRAAKSKSLYVMYKNIISEAELTRQSLLFQTEFGINTMCMCSRTIAGLIIDSSKEGELFVDGINERSIESDDYDYMAAAFHTITIASPDVIKFKGQVYDETLLFKISTQIYTSKEQLIKDVILYLNLPENKSDVMSKRFDSLLSRGMIHKNGDIFTLSESVSKDIEDRKNAYLFELESLTSAQTDLMREDFNVNWNAEDSKKISTLLALAAVDDKIKVLREAKTDIDHPIFRLAKGSDKKIIKFLINDKQLTEKEADRALDELAQMASYHPLVIKISRACMYLALEGVNPISYVNALGANSWVDFKVMLEPTVAIPFICSRLYDTGEVAKSFEYSIKSVKTAKTLTTSVSVPYFYVNECASHLMSARRYDGLELDPMEMALSSNAFVANYYSLLNAGSKLPSSFMDYLSTFSPAIRYEKANIKAWRREIMTDIDSLLRKDGIIIEELPKYESDDLKEYETDFSLYLRNNCKEKPSHLIHHDAMALKFINERINKQGEHWIILSYDKALTTVGNDQRYKGWICKPKTFLDMTTISLPLSETQMVSVLHSVASFSEKTLEIGAKIMDRIIQYTKVDMKNWEFKQELDKFKNEMKQTFAESDSEDDTEFIQRTDMFLKSKGVDIDEEDGDMTSL